MLHQLDLQVSIVTLVTAVNQNERQFFYFIGVPDGI
jgi:hypothetical protein